MPLSSEPLSLRKQTTGAPVDAVVDELVCVQTETQATPCWSVSVEEHWPAAPLATARVPLPVNPGAVLTGWLSALGAGGSLSP